MWGLFEAVQAVLADQQQHRTIHPGDCQACGSQEFRHWHGRSVCAYCRSVADAPPLTHPALSVRCTDRLIIARPHAYARITTD